MDWWILAFSILGAVGGAAGAFLTWWRQEQSVAFIEVRRDDKRVVVRFMAVGSRPLHKPETEIVYDGISYAYADMPSVLSGSDKPVEITFPANPGLPAQLTAAIQWTEFGSRAPRLRGLKFGSLGETWNWNRRKGWVPLSERQLRRLQRQYSQL